MPAVVQTGTGNVTTTNGQNVTSVTVAKPANTVDGDLFLALVYHRNSGATLTAPSGWTWAKQDAVNATYGVAYKAIPSAAAETATSYAFSTSGGSGRMTTGLVRVTGANLASPLDATGTTSGTTGTTSLTMPSMNAGVAGALLIAVETNNGGSTVSAFTPDPAMTGIAQINVKTPDGTGSCNTQFAQQQLTSTGATGTRTCTMSPAANNSSGFLMTIKAAAEAHSGSGSITGAVAMAAAGTPAVAGAGSVAGALAMSGSGTVATGGEATLGGALTMSARGVADTGIGLPVKGKPRWQFLAGPASGGYEVALSRATARTYTARLTDNSELSFTLDTDTAQAAYLQPLSTDVHVLFTDDTGRTTEIDRLRVGQPNITIDDNKARVAWTCLDYRAVLARRLLYSGATLTYSNVDQGEIAWSLVEYTQGLPSGELNIAKGWVGSTPTGVLRSPTFEAGDSIGQRIEEMSDLVGGFDWAVTPTSASALQLGVWFPQRGASRGVVLEQGGLMAEATVNEDTTTYANAIRYTGADGLTAFEQDAGGLAGMPQGRWDAAYGDTGLTTQQMLNDRAEWQLGWSQVARPVWTVKLRRDAWRGPSHIWLGDTVRIVAMRHGLGVDMTARVYEIEVQLDGDGTEQVQLTLNGPRSRFAWRARDVEKRLTNLERR
jgi:hypothetical protein